MKDLSQFIREQLEVETIDDKMQVWLLQHPEEQALWAKVCGSYDETHQYDEISLQQFVEMTDIKALLQFLQDDKEVDISGIDVSDTMKKIIANRR